MAALDKADSLAELDLTPESVLADYRLGFQSRQASLIGRREVMSGKAKFGIFGDGKELPQLAMARYFKKGDFRSGYYRDQTLMFALGATTIREQFAQLFAHADPVADPASAGRQMNAHFSTRSLDSAGNWNALVEMFNSSPDVSPTGSQMPRLTGLAYASRLFREIEDLRKLTQFSHNGDEVAFGTIGNASCAEGMFWEAVNAIGVLRAPAVISIWDDGYGISVTNEHQMIHQDVSRLLDGFQRDPGGKGGYDIYRVKNWDYPALNRVYRQATRIARREHIPAIIHVTEATQPQGHSTSGSHERYKSSERLAWEQEFDCLEQMRRWMLEIGITDEETLSEIETNDRKFVEEQRAAAWRAYQQPIQEDIREVTQILNDLPIGNDGRKAVGKIVKRLNAKPNPYHSDTMAAVHKALRILRQEPLKSIEPLIQWKKNHWTRQDQGYGEHLFSQSERSTLKVPEIAPIYSDRSPTLQGYQVMNACFDALLERDPRVVAFGEDLGQIGDVNQGFAGLQKKYGPLRVSDTGIRETTILGQAIGLAMRGLRPIAEIQYLDYLLYALQIMSDDLATTRWRSAGGQMAPVIIRTRGHRLEGIWHSGSPMAGVINLVRGVHVLVPRNMVQAAGFYNTLLLGDDPGVIVEVLNGYRLKERMPDNIGSFTVPVGVPEILRPGEDVSVVTYGASCRVAMAAAEMLADAGVDTELIDVRALLPFDIHGMILESLKKTNRVLFLDEDVPGGSTAYMMQQVLEVQGGFRWLDSDPVTLSAKEHRPAYGTDGNYWSKPNAEQVFETVYRMMHEVRPADFPLFF